MYFPSCRWDSEAVAKVAESGEKSRADFNRLRDCSSNEEHTGRTSSYLRVGKGKGLLQLLLDPATSC